MNPKEERQSKCFSKPAASGTRPSSWTTASATFPPNVGLQQEVLQLIEDIHANVHGQSAPPSPAPTSPCSTRDAVNLAGGPAFYVPLGRLDSLAPASDNDVRRLQAPAAHRHRRRAPLRLQRSEPLLPGRPCSSRSPERTPSARRAAAPSAPSPTSPGASPRRARRSAAASWGCSDIGRGKKRYSKGGPRVKRRSGKSRSGTLRKPPYRLFSKCPHIFSHSPLIWIATNNRDPIIFKIPPGFRSGPPDPRVEGVEEVRSPTHLTYESPWSRRSAPICSRKPQRYPTARTPDGQRRAPFAARPSSHRRAPAVADPRRVCG
nr:serine/arginine repetitive matrix protein 2-like [Setaria viridis]